MWGHLIVLALNSPSATPFLVGIVFGFALGAFGHIIKSSPVIVLGIVAIGLTTVLFIIATDPTLGGGG